MVSSIADTMTGKASTELLWSDRLTSSVALTTVLQVVSLSSCFELGAFPVLSEEVLLDNINLFLTRASTLILSLFKSKLTSLGTGAAFHMSNGLDALRTSAMLASPSSSEDSDSRVAVRFLGMRSSTDFILFRLRLPGGSALLALLSLRPERSRAGGFIASSKVA